MQDRDCRCAQGCRDVSRIYNHLAGELSAATDIDAVSLPGGGVYIDGESTGTCLHKVPGERGHLEHTLPAWRQITAVVERVPGTKLDRGARVKRCVCLIIEHIYAWPKVNIT